MWCIAIGLGRRGHVGAIGQWVIGCGARGGERGVESLRTLLTFPVCQLPDCLVDRADMVSPELSHLSQLYRETGSTHTSLDLGKQRALHAGQHTIAGDTGDCVDIDRVLSVSWCRQF